ncbi:hypothetical protein ACH4U6_29565 [Streptomyces netropsis]|uniref:Antibiotic biosynthesis monooxygenase n=1 Tax=Streptomyces netropsis TaxID=55404 RepID=A0A7W7PEU1_STRNE|nr:hypothetical protein [Streptomyces netropsis]MBB4886533.1 hypothetical protein [Streptomyces netropsis]GGR20845.1 hypothetical protein GCM10010219_27250 [Streptomyces netropsis]
MAIFMHAILPGVTAAQYDALNSALRDLPGDTFAGCLAHVAVTTDAGLQVFDLWESEEAMAAFTERLMPHAERAGFPSTGEPPQVLPVHNYWLPGA